MEPSRGGLVVRSRPRDRRVPGSKHTSTEDPPCSGQTPSRCCRAEASRGRSQLRRHSRQMNVVQNYESVPKYPSCCFKTGRYYNLTLMESNNMTACKRNSPRHLTCN
ncbi:hypothetical protein AVEN_127424-1 [Araneus ventricosus]|uniref:Uncharacterized protein n=1 Tax=Araneus ventricosus TaxID=182803 RepID=A0A4Y2TM29_ARAVE|nr:hypothetical protein AVEN_127424-1 [Araneus ventricosus]